MTSNPQTTRRILRNTAIQERLIKGFSDVIYREIGTNTTHGWDVVNALILMAATIAYRSGAQLGDDVTAFAESVKEQTSEALSFMIKRCK